MMSLLKTLYKAVKTDVFTTLSKRRYKKIKNDVDIWLTSAINDIFMTSSTEMQSMNLFSTDSTTSLLSLTETLMSQCFKKIIIDCSDKEFKLVKNVVNTFHQRSVHMNEDAIKAVKTVLNKHALKTQDIIKLKNVKITELQNRITALKTE